MLILIDADTTAKGYGFAKRKADIDNAMQVQKISVPYFIYPNNNDDGDVETLMESSTRMYASKKAMEDPAKKQKIMELKMLFETVLNARNRVMLEMNCAEDKFDNLIKGIPSMKSPTVSPLFGGNGYAIKIAVKKSEVPTLLPKLQSLGATDIVEYELRKVML